MKRHLLALLITVLGFQPAWSNTIVSNTATSFTLNTPCSPVSNGTYTVQFNYFDLSIGDWVPGPDNSVFTEYSGVVVANDGNGNVVYDFSNASPVPNFPLDMSTSQGWIRIPSTGGQMNFDNHQLNCPSLPVDLISFTARLVNCQVELKFVTADEYDMTQFIIERNSTCAYGFDMAVCSKTPVNDNQGHTYTCTDNSPLVGINYYRLKMVGLGGYIKYSKIVYVNASSCGPPPAPINCSGVSISGPDQLCYNTAGNYTLSNLPACVTNNTWSFYSNNYNATLTNSGGSATTVNSPSWNANGEITLMSFRPQCTVGTQYSYKTITLGKGPFSGVYYPNYDPFNPHTLYEDVWGDNVLGNGSYNVINVTSPSGSKTWTKTAEYSPPGQPISWSVTQFGNLIINMPSSGYGQIEFQMTTPSSCGTDQYYFYFFTGGAFRLTPNPASSEVTISLQDKLGSTGRLQNKSLLLRTIRQVQIVDRLGHTVMHKAYGPDTKQVNINTSGLKPDFYIARIYDGKSWQVVKFIKK